MSIPSRISDQTLYLGNVFRYDNLLSQQNLLESEISSGIRLQSADQDPVATALAQQENTLEAQLTQDQSNITQATSFASATESAINTAMTSIQQAEQLAVEGNDGTMSTAALQQIANQVNQMINGMLSTANSEFGGKNLFGGSSTDTANPPFVATTDAAGNILSVSYQGNQDSLSTVIGQGVTVQYNLQGNGVASNGFGVFQDNSGGGFDIFNTLIQLRNDLQTGNSAGLSTDIQNIQTSVSHLTEALSLTGSAQQLMQNQQTKNQSNMISNQQALSNNQDTDMAAAISELTALQTSYQAALKVGAQITQNSLLNYI